MVMENHKVLGFMNSGVLAHSDYCEHTGNLGPSLKQKVDENKMKI